jgi:hypothetical protein
MRCAACNVETRVAETRRRSDGVYRRRICPSCNTRFSTVETLVQEKPGPKKAEPEKQAQPAPAKAAKPAKHAKPWPFRKEAPAPRRREDDFWLRDVEDYGNREYRDDLKEMGIDLQDFD